MFGEVAAGAEQQPAAPAVTQPAAGRSDRPAPPASTDSPERDVLTGEELAAILDELAVQPEQRHGYDRGDWPHWGSGRAGDGLNVRHEVLADESWCPVTVRDGYVTGGCWWSVYDQLWVQDPAALDVDHIVALQEAHDSGGFAWDVAAREAFANWHRGLVAVSSATNRAKSAADPAGWLPDSGPVRCAFVRSWLQIKHAWALSVDADERAALQDAISDCPTAVGLHTLEPPE